MYSPCDLQGSHIEIYVDSRRSKMSNSNSALVRSNLGRNTALSTASQWGPKFLEALMQIAKSGQGSRSRGNGAEPVRIVYEQRRSNRNRKGKGRQNGGAGPSGVPRPVLSSNFPSIRRTISLVLSLTSSGSDVTTFHNWVVARSITNTTARTALLSDAMIGTQNAAFLNSYRNMQIHSVTMNIIPALAANSRGTYALGWNTVPDTPTITSLAQYTAYSNWVITGRDEKTISVRPHGVHGNVMPTNVTDSDDQAENALGCFAGHFVANTTGLIGYIQCTIALTLLDG